MKHIKNWKKKKKKIFETISFQNPRTESKAHEVFELVQPSEVKPCSSLGRELTKGIFKIRSLTAVWFP